MRNRMDTVFHTLAIYDRRAVWAAIGLVVVSASLYAYFLAASIFAVVERNQAERKIEALAGVVSGLESKYVEVGKRIDLSLARERGFHEVVSPRYISLVPETARPMLSLAPTHP